MINTCVESKEKTSAVLVPIVLGLLKSLRVAAAEFAGVIGSKVPEELESLTRELVEGVDEPFRVGIEAYS